MLTERLTDYVQYDTTSHKGSDTFPSSEGQWVLARHLKEELETLGLSDVRLDEYCYVYAFLPGDEDYYAIGLNSHMDTSEQACGKNVKPKISS